MSDYSTAAQILVRRFDITSEFKLGRLYATPATLMVLPSGMMSASVAVVVGDASYARTVNVTRAGQVRVQ